MASSSRKESKQLIILHISVGVGGLAADHAVDFFNRVSEHFSESKETDTHIIQGIVTEDRDSFKIDIKCVYPINIIYSDDIKSLIPSPALIESLRKEVEVR